MCIYPDKYLYLARNYIFVEKIKMKIAKFRQTSGPAKLRASVAVAAIAAVFACTTSEPDLPVRPVVPSAPAGDVVISSSLEQPAETKTALSGNDADGYVTVWQENDKFSVVGLADGASKSATFTLSGDAGDQNGSFTGTFPQGCTDMYAVFPQYGSSAAVKADGSAITLKIPEQKNLEYNNVAKNLMPAVAKVVQSGGNNTVEFHNLFGLLRITLTSPKSLRFRKMELIDLGGNILWGDCTVPIVNGEPDYEHISLSGGTNSIYLQGNEAYINSTTRSFYFCVPPGALDNGFAIRIYEYDKDRANYVGREYSILQKITGTAPMPRSTIQYLSPTTITDKSEPLNAADRGYYKTLFIDAGIMLDSFYSTDSSKPQNYIPALTAMGLENDYEYIQTNNQYDETKLAQASIITGTNGDSNFPSDKNGVLLYPDGEPRFRAIFVNGGTSETHGTSLGADGRGRIKRFVDRGGSYIGACAGAILAATSVDGVNHYDNTDETVTNYTFGLWPGNASHTGWPANYGEEGVDSNIYTGITVSDLIAEKSQSLTADETIEPVRHHGGVYAQEKYVTPENTANIAGTNVLGRYVYSYWQEGWPGTPAQYANPENLTDPTNDFLGTNRDHNGQVAIWAYRPTGNKVEKDKGCVIMSGSHFETSTAPDQIEYFSSMFRYALDGNGDYHERIRSLTLGTTRKMNNTTYNETGDNWNAPIGDRQYHHFKFTTDDDIEDFELELSSSYDKDSGIDLYLCLNNGSFAWLSNSEYVLTNKGGQKTLRIKNLPKGTWYVGVFCATTVETTVKTSPPRYLKYTGKTQVLDGIAYSITPRVAASASSAATKASAPVFTDNFDE